jgi:hypothetical protein
MKNLESIIDKILENSTRIYLIIANVVLVVFAIWFSNAGLLPFKNIGDFAFFVILSMILAIYRPSWTFAFFVGTIMLENINLMPTSFGLALRPYQFFGFITIISLFIQFVSKRLVFSLPKMKWVDVMPIIFIIGGFLGSLVSVNRGMSLKQSIIAATFVALYYLARIYVQSLDDLKRVVPFFLSSSVVVVVYALWQNLRFLAGKNAFEVMPGRPNGTFTEADWLGVFLVFLLSMILTIIYALNKKSLVISNQSSTQQVQEASMMTDDRLLITVNYLKQIFLYLLLTLTAVVLILTVSRSAWIGAIIVVVGYLKFVLYDGSWKISAWQGKKFGMELVKMFGLFLISIGLISMLGLTKFQLGNRAVSTGGMQKITIACTGAMDVAVPQSIGSIEELGQYGCRHINLEEIDNEKNAGNVVMEVFRPDPNVGIRSRIYHQSFEQIKAHPIMGIGWGSISRVLGNDERGAGLNASNIFLEVWLGAGILGILSLVVLLLYIFIIGAKLFFRQNNELQIVSAFVLLSWSAIVFPNLFNSGIFLGFVWAYLGIAISLLNEKK